MRLHMGKDIKAVISSSNRVHMATHWQLKWFSLLLTWSVHFPIWPFPCRSANTYKTLNRKKCTSEKAPQQN